MPPKKGSSAKAKTKTKPKAAPKKAAGPASDEESDAEPEAGSWAQEPRLLPPKKTFEGAQDKEKYTNWRRATMLWRSKYELTSDKRLGASLCEVIGGEAEDLVFASLAEGGETFTAVMEILDGAYGEKGLPEAIQAQNAFDEAKRGKKSLGDFLTLYKTARSKAIRHGLTPSPATDGAKLLQACQLTATQQTGVLQTLRLEAKLAGKVFAQPEYKATLDALEMLAQTLSMQDEGKKVEKRPAGLLSATDPVPKRPRWDDQPKGPGKGPATKGPKGLGKGTGACNQFAQSGKCSYGDACRFRHDGGGKPKGKKGKDWKKGGDKGKSSDGKPAAKVPCRSWAKDGTCTYGDGCRFSH